ncbi:hypothetical protein, partial [Oceanidesulfovibrio marinus]
MTHHIGIDKRNGKGQMIRENIGGSNMQGDGEPVERREVVGQGKRFDHVVLPGEGGLRRDVCGAVHDGELPVGAAVAGNGEKGVVVETVIAV